MNSVSKKGQENPALSPGKSLKRLALYLRSCRRMNPRFYSTLLLGLLLAVLTGCGGDKQDSPPLGSGELRWSNFPVSLQADATILQDPDALQDLQDALIFWQEKAGKPLFTLLGPYTSAPYVGDPSDPASLAGNGIFFLSPWPFESGVAGRTLVFSTGTLITASAIALNPATDLCTGDCTASGDQQRTSRRRLLAHELGHFLGFNHNDDRGNIMYPAILPGGGLSSMSVDTELLIKLTN